MAPLRVVRAFRLSIIALTATLALSGCMRASAPVATAQPRDLDSLAYGRSSSGASAYAGVPAGARYDTAYRLDAGDRLRVVVYGQEGLTNTYAIDAGGAITLPLIGSVAARGRTTSGLAAEIGAKLRSETAVAIAGGFSPRAKRDRVTLTHAGEQGSTRIVVPLGTSVSPGDTVLVGERWF